MNNDIETRVMKMAQSEYFDMSEGRTVVTPENLSGLISYQAMFAAMADNRELRPALSDAMSTGRAMNDFLSMPNDEFLKAYTVADGPINPKTNKPYGTETKAYAEWRATQDRTPISTAQYDMFGKMATAYKDHAAIKAIEAETGVIVRSNAVFSANIEGARCACKVDRLYELNGKVCAVDVTTTDDLMSFSKTADHRLNLRERYALMYMILEKNGIDVSITNKSLLIAAIEKSEIPRCGVFYVSGKDLTGVCASLSTILRTYANSVTSGKYVTYFEEAREL